MEFATKVYHYDKTEFFRFLTWFGPRARHMGYVGTNMWWNIFLSECCVTDIASSFNESSTVTLISLLPMLCCAINSEPRYITQEDLVMTQRFSCRPLTRSNPMSLSKVFVWRKVALWQVFTEYCGLTFSVSFHQYSIRFHSTIATQYGFRK
jgi:hypothetical protein